MVDAWKTSTALPRKQDAVLEQWGDRAVACGSDQTTQLFCEYFYWDRAISIAYALGWLILPTLAEIIETMAWRAWSTYI